MQMQSYDISEKKHNFGRYSTEFKFKTNSNNKNIMKKLMKLSVLFAGGLLLAGTLHAQVLKTYMSENFEGQSLSSGWSLSECTPITTSATGTLYVEQINDGSTTWGGWGYDPNKQIINASINNKLDGTYALVTKSFRMEDNSINVVTLDYWYLGTSSNNSQERLFGVSVRTGNGEWQDLDSVQNMANGLEGQISLILDEELNGQDVQLRLFFRNKHNANAYFFLLIDNVTFAAYKNTPYYSAHIADPYFYAVDAAENAEVNLDLAINNMGPKAISSIEYAYITDNGTQKNTTATFSSPVPAVTGQASTKASIRFSNGIFGENNIKMWPVKVNGEDFEATDTLTHQVTLIDKSNAKNDFVPMLESFTSATCGPCATMNRYLKSTLEELKGAGKINVVKYQMNFPGNGDKYYIASNRTRMSYYDQLFGWGNYWGVPAPIFNAESNMLDWPGQTYNDLMALLKQKTEEAHAQKAFMDINIQKATIDAATGKLDFEVEVTSALDVTANLVVVITEKTTKGNRGSNGETSFNYVTMVSPLGGNGQTCSFKTDSTISLSGSTDMSTTHMEEATDLEIVCFVQAPLQKNAYIFQSASSDVAAMNVANESKDNLQVALYPNPAKGYTMLKGLENAHVSVFDMTGRVVYNTTSSEESLNIDLSRFTAGTYMVRIEQNGATAHKKLVVTK